MNKAIKLGLIPVVLFMNSGLINAATPGAYFGLGIGASSLEPQFGLYKDKESGFGGRVFAGYNFNRYLGLETNYSTLGKTRYFDINYPQFAGDYTLSALSLVGKAYLPFSDENPFNLYAQVGAAQVYGKYDVVYHSVSLVRSSDHGFVPTAGIGATYDINQRLTLGLEFSGFGEIESSYRLGVPSSALATLSLAYKF